MATVKQIIGRVKGDKGETGPTNEIIATVYSYRVTQSPEVPTDGWLPSLPDFNQGDYVWTRTQCTWTAGPDTTMICVGYIGKDGDIASIDVFDEYGRRITALEDQIIPISKGGLGTTTLEGAQARLGITELKSSVDERFAKINDYTTGINLLRGTRDYRQGYKAFGKTGYFIDGNYVNKTYFSLQKEDWYTTVSYLGNASSLVLCVASIIPYSDFLGTKGNKVTFSFDIKLESAGIPASTFLMQIYRLPNDNSSGTVLWNAAMSSFNIDTSIVGKWQKAVYTLELDGTITPNDGIRVSLRSTDAYKYTVRLQMAQENEVKKPIWAEAPEDIDTINDITSIPNLVRGSRDFVQGTKKPDGVTSNIYMDGFYYTTAVSSVVGEDGYSYITNGSNTAAKADVMAALNLDDCRNGLTISFEYWVSDASAYRNSDPLYVAYRTQSLAGISGNQFKMADNLIDNGTIESGKWYKFQCYYGTAVPDTAALLSMTLRFDNPGCELRYRKFYAVPGNIRNTKWNDSAFDRAQQADMVKLESGAPYLMGDVLPDNAIKSGDNLDNFKTPGIYGCNSTTTPTIENEPWTSGAFRLYVEYSNNGTGNYIRQTAIKSSGDVLETRIRVWEQTVWRPWRDVVNNRSVIPYPMGGTNANTLAGAKNNLGITALESRVQTLEQQIASLIS